MLTADHVRAVLSRVAIPPASSAGAFGWMAVAALQAAVPAWPAGYDLENDVPIGGRGRWQAYALRNTGLLRLAIRWPAWRRPVADAAPFVDSYRGGVSFTLKGVRSPAEGLWAVWMLELARRAFAPALRPRTEELWRYVFRRAGDGPLTPSSSAGPASLDAVVYDELCSIHAAYNIACLLDDAGKMDTVRRAVRWHVENTQPDHATNEPWALAAFAALDDTGTFAETQLHAAAAHLTTTPIEGDQAPMSVGLLADAIFTMDEDATHRA